MKTTLIDFAHPSVRPVLGRLLQDKTTKQNIIFATDAYAANGDEFTEKAQITEEKLFGMGCVTIQPRVEKAASEQQARTRKKAEVFTPSWIVNKMNNHCDEEWFDRTDVFNKEDGTSWITNPTPIAFTEKRTWQAYVDSRRIEITCGEAPYIVSRYDAATGEIIPIANRIGILDRKLRVLNENAKDDAEWLKWTERALQSTYGYEFQGDNLLIARINVLMTIVENYEARFRELPDITMLRRFTNTICWNFWQMDGITGTIPFSIPQQGIDKYQQFSLFDSFNDEITEEKPDTTPVCKVWDWRRGNAISYDDIRGGN